MSDWFNTFNNSFWLPEESLAANEAQFLWRVLRLRPGTRVLDCPCGTGRISIELAKRKASVTGIDFQPRFVRQARRRFKRAGLEATFEQGDMREITYISCFDAAINWSGSFGYFDDAGNAQVVRALSRALVPGGLLVLDQLNRQSLLRNFKSRDRRGDIRVCQKWDAQTQRLEAIWSRRQATKRIHSRISLRLYTPRQVKALLHQAGLRLESLKGSTDGSDYLSTSPRLIVIAEKPPVGQ